MAANIVDQPPADLKAIESTPQLKGLLHAEHRLALAHELLHQLFDRGGLSSLSTENYDQMMAIIENLDEGYRIVQALMEFLSSSLGRKK